MFASYFQDYCILDVLQELVDLAFTYLELLGTASNASSELVEVKGFATSVSFDDHQRFVFNAFIAGKSISALIALSSPTYGRTTRVLSRLQDLVIHRCTVWATHLCNSFGKVYWYIMHLATKNSVYGMSNCLLMKKNTTIYSVL